MPRFHEIDFTEQEVRNLRLYHLSLDPKFLLATITGPLPFADAVSVEPAIVRWSQAFQSRVQEVRFPVRVENLLLRISRVSTTRWTASGGAQSAPYLPNPAPFTHQDHLLDFDEWAARVVDGTLERKIRLVAGFGPNSVAYSQLVEHLTQYLGA